MFRRGRIVLFAIACVLPLVSCETASEHKPPAQEGSVCVKTCEATFDECSRRCTNDVENDRCSDFCM